MKHGTSLETDRLIIRNWTLSETDRKIWHELNSDEKIMHYFPFRRNRAQSDEILEKLLNIVQDTGYGWAVACLKKTSKPIGFTGLAFVNFDATFTPATEIGWRYLVRYWGNGYATEAAMALIDHGFNDMGLEKIVSFAVPQNRESTAVMKRLGMRPNPKMDFDHPAITDKKYAHLRRHVYYEISKTDWSIKKAATL